MKIDMFTLEACIKDAIERTGSHFEDAALTFEDDRAANQLGWLRTDSMILFLIPAVWRGLETDQEALTRVFGVTLRRINRMVVCKDDVDFQRQWIRDFCATHGLKIVTME